MGKWTNVAALAAGVAVGAVATGARAAELIQMQPNTAVSTSDVWNSNFSDSGATTQTYTFNKFNLSQGVLSSVEVEDAANVVVGVKLANSQAMNGSFSATAFGQSTITAPGISPMTTAVNVNNTCLANFACNSENYAGSTQMLSQTLFGTQQTSPYATGGTGGTAGSTLTLTDQLSLSYLHIVINATTGVQSENATGTLTVTPQLLELVYNYVPHAIASFGDGPSPLTTLNVNFGTVMQGATDPIALESISNLVASGGDGLDLDGVTVTSPTTGPFNNDLYNFTGLGPGQTSNFFIGMSTLNAGDFSETLELNLADSKDYQGLGMQTYSLTLNISGDVVAPPPPPIIAPGVPEPAEWALLVGGFGLAGAALRARRRVAG